MKIPASGPRRWLTVAAIVIVGLPTIVIATGWATKQALIDQLLKGAGYNVVQRPDGSTRIEVPAEKIPRTFDDREDSPSAGLLPAHWEKSADLPGEGDAAVVVPESTRRELLETTLGFLTRWETFAAGASPEDFSAWQSELAPYVADEASTRVFQRQESAAPAAVCPEPPCTIGSAWYSGYPAARPLLLRDFDGDQAYVTGYGLVRYDDPRGEIDGRLTLREYAVLLSHHGDDWLVTRVVADTVR